MKRQPRHLDGTFAKSYKTVLREILRQLFTRKSYYTFTLGSIIVLLTAITLYYGSIKPFISQFTDNKIIGPVKAQTVSKEEMFGTIREVTMYSSTPEQTDNTPCIAANNQDVCILWKNGQNICATNAFPLGTKLKVDKLGTCLVDDRMNDRFSNRIDWYAGYDDDCLDGVDQGDVCPNYDRALNFGLQKLLVSEE